MYAERTPPQEPPCYIGNEETKWKPCRTDLLPENEDAAVIYMIVRRQYVTAEQGRIVDLNIQTVKIVMDLWGIVNQRDCLKRVMAAFHGVMGKALESGELESGAYNG